MFIVCFPRAFSPKTLALALCFAVALLTLKAAAASSKQFDLDMEEQQTQAALIALGVQLGISIILPEHVSLAPKSRALRGSYSVYDALTLLLADSAASFRQLGPSIYLIHASEANSSPAPVVEELSVTGYRTGSHIFRTTSKGSAPLDEITAQELQRAGTQSLSDLIKFIPAVSGNSTSTAISNGGDGTTKVTLRGLPANNTLVLINGQRVSFDGLAGDSVDLNSFPPLIIKQIDIYKDGASAIYGSEAIAGVVNIETLTHYQGLKLNQYLGQSYDGHLFTSSTDALWGHDGPGLSGLFAVNYYSQQGLFSRDRELSANADARSMGGIDNRSSATPNSRISFDNSQSLILKDHIISETPGVDDFRETSSEDLYNFNEQNSTISPSSRLSAYGFFSADVGENMAWHNQIIASQTEATITLASTPLFTAFTDSPITVSMANRYNPFGVDIQDVRRRIIELEPREQRNESDSIHLNSGLSIDYGVMTWKLNAFWNQVKASEHILNLVDGDKAARALGPTDNCRGLQEDGCEALNLFGSTGSISEAQLDFIRAENLSKGSSELVGGNIDFTGTAINSTGLLFSYAGGFEARQEESLLTIHHQGNNIVGGFYHSPTRGKRKVYEAYGELLIPVVENRLWAESIELELAARVANSSDFGMNFSPKLGFKYSVNSQLAFRGTYSKGYRAPSIKELYKTGSKSYARLSDPCALDNATETYIGCDKQSDPSLNQFLTEYVGDPNLSPEISKSFTLGVEFSPESMSNIQFSADLFDIRLRNIIDSNPQVLLDENARRGLFSNLIQRDDNGNIVLIEAPFINIGRRQVQGIDFNLRSQFKNLYWSLNASYLRKYQQQLNQFTQKQELAGTFRDAAENGNGSLPRFKGNTGVSWLKDNFDLSYSINYISGTKESLLTNAGEVERKMDDWFTHNMQLQCHFDSYSIGLGVDNIVNRAPPFSASAFSDNYDAHAYDIKGRFLYFKIGKQF